MRFVDIMIIAFMEGMHSSHGHVLLNMRYNTTLIARIGWLKPCLTGIECWIPAERSKVQRSATSLFERWLQRGKFHKFNAALQTFEDQVLIKKYVMMDVQMTHLSYNLNNFSTVMSSVIGDWSHVWLALSVDCRQKYYKINAAKHAIRDSGVRRIFSCGGFSFSGIWWSFVFGVRCLWRHNLTSYIYVSKATFWRRFLTKYAYFCASTRLILYVIALNINY